ncbi:MAG TPA: DUF302 domain-containing protein [Chromatiaceae bacterium]|nr:DUF302 domain-containing protein [Chromatiaceae bacterium]HIN82010.1 DUF302 domain-containing protein [Chromatiales bacterium]
MGPIRNVLALIGLIALIAAGTVFIQGKAILDKFDPGAFDVYFDMSKKLIETQNGAEATIWKIKVEEGLTPEEVEQSMKNIANELNIKNVGELPLSKEVSAQTGEDYRFVKIFMFCNAVTAARMMDYSDAFSAYLPCRITLLEDKTGQLWLYTLNMDMMIHGGAPLPTALRTEAIGVKQILLDIMNRAAEGDF